MHVPWDARFAEEARRYDLRFTCEDCGHFDAAREACRHGWPVELHRRSRYQRDGVDEIVFCKEFELA
jgi:hypothetical protein